jgi:hypothetical protein
MQRLGVQERWKIDIDGVTESCNGEGGDPIEW